MKTIERVTKTLVYASELHPEIETDREEYRKVIEWADAHPVVWRIVRENKSAPWGKKSSTYMGCGRDDSADSVLYRAGVLLGAAHGVGETGLTQTEPFWAWRAQFTIDHYTDKGFKGGFFQQFDGTYPRNCTDLDYTPATRELVIDQFVAWCKGREGTLSGYVTREVWIDKQVVRRLQP